MRRIVLAAIAAAAFLHFHPNLATASDDIVVGGAEVVDDILVDVVHDDFLQVSQVAMSNVISGSPITVDGATILTTGSISGLSQENIGGINVMMVNTGPLSSQQNVISTNTSVTGLDLGPGAGATTTGAN
jgi:hypothetical protein